MISKINRRTFTKTIAAGTLGFLTGCQSRNQFKIIIKNGTIIDGSGTRTFEKDIGIIGDKIAAIDELKNATADIIIDGKGLVVSPGFIDIHTHTDLQLIVNPRAESKILQGVTTEVSGNCGSSPFPFNDSDFKEADENTFERYGFHVDWRNIEAFLRKLEDQKVSINYATLTGHGSLRSCVIGKKDVQPTVEQLAEMKNILERTMQEGSFGLSTGLEYAPGSYALTSELIELNKTVARHNGVYATHMRSEYDRVEEAVQEALQICKKAEVSLQISHLKAANHANWGKVDHMLEMIHGAAESGMPVNADRYPYIAYSTGLTGFLPLWCLQGNTDDVLNRLRDKTLITKIRDYTENEGKNIGGWDRVMISYCFSDKNKLWEGKTISVCAKESDTTPFEFIQNLLLEERNRVDIVGFAMDEFNLKNILSSPLVMIGSDGNAVAPYGKLGEGKPHPRFYGTFPRVLGKYSRDETLFDLSTAVMKMTSMPATKLGLRNRGLIAKDYFADIVVFNPETVIDNATFEDPHQFPSGIEYVIVNGELTIRNGKHTGAKAGTMLSHIS